VSVSAVAESVFTTIQDQLSEEIGALLGTTIKFVEPQLQILNKEQILAISRGRSVISTMVVSGDNNGEAYIITDLKDSVILGGTLIMLPKEQIEENCKTRDFSGEAADAFGEVANIIAGVYTTVFLDLHPQNYHFKRTSVADFVPTQVDPKSDNIFPQGDYVYSRCSIKLEDAELHNLEVIIPAQLIGEGSAEKETATEPTADKDTADSQTEQQASPVEKQEPEEENSPTPEVSATDLVDKETIDRVLHAALEQCAEEIGAMLGLEIGIEGITTRYTSKHEFFAKPGKKTIATQMVVSGEQEGTAYFLTDLKDAIYLAGTMIMLPAEEMEKHISANEFGEDEADAFGEVTNIVSGGLVQNFDEIYPRKLHLKKGAQELFTPSKVQLDDPTPFPPGEYYIASGTLSCKTRELSEISFLAPVELLHMVPRPAESGWGDPAPSTDSTAPDKPAKPSANDTKQESTTTAKPTETTAPEDSPSATEAGVEKTQVIVVVCDDEPLSKHFVDSLSTSDKQTLVFNSADSFNDLRKKTVLGTFFVMTKVTEQSFATMIKIRAEIPQESPLIVAGPQWTRSDVLKAVRYGASDILVTPASVEEICEKTKTNLKITCH